MEFRSNMERALKVLNALEQEGALGRYAIGGAIAALFYTEPTATYDLDIFVVLPQMLGGLIDPSPLYAALRDRGYVAEREFVMVEGVPVQFLPAYNPLVEEALEAAWERPFEHTTTRVLRPEHLMAIALQTGRAKDRQRVAQLLSQATLDQDYLAAVLKRHGLTGRWAEWTS